MTREHSNPEIISFESSQMSVGKNEPFTLSWVVENTDGVEIYKNGGLLTKLEGEVTSYTVNEYYDGRDKDVVFSLVAINESGKTKSSPLVIKITSKPVSSGSAPVINYFRSSADNVGSNEPYVLDWNVKNAVRLELFKNGFLEKTLAPDSTQIELSGFYDGQPKNLEYSLVAVSAGGQSKRENLTIKIIDRAPDSQGVTVETDLTVLDELVEPGEPPAPAPTDLAPVIVAFNSSASQLQEGDKFTLSWNVENARYIQVYRNGVEFTEVTGDENSIEITAVADGGSRRVTFMIYAGNDNTSVKSAPVFVNVDKQVIKHLAERNPNVLKAYLVGGVVLIVLIIAAFLFFTNPFGKPAITDLAPDSIVEGHTVVIKGKNFPTDTASFQVLFNKVKGSIVSSTRNGMLVTIPALAADFAGGNVDVSLIYKNDTIHAEKKLVVTRPESQATVTQTVPTEEPEQIPEAPVTSVVKVKKDPRILKPGPTDADTIASSTPVDETPKDATPKKKISIYDMVKITNNDYKSKTLWGVKGLKLTIQNDSPFELESVNVTVSYLKKNEREVKKQNVVFTKVAPKSTSSMDVPSTNRGAKVSYSISNISSRQYEADLKQ